MTPKIAVYNGFPFHYEMFGYLIDWSISRGITLDIYTNNQHDMGCFDFHVKQFGPRFNVFPCVELTTQKLDSYRRLILTTDDDWYFPRQFPNISEHNLGKIVSIEHDNWNRTKFGNPKIGTRFFISRPEMPWAIPTYRLISPEEKRARLQGKIRIAAVGNGFLPGYRMYDFGGEHFVGDNLEFHVISREIDPTCFSGFRNIHFHSELDTSTLVEVLKDSHYVFHYPDKRKIFRAITGVMLLAPGCLAKSIICRESLHYYLMGGIFPHTIEYSSDSVLSLSSDTQVEQLDQDLLDLIQHRNFVLDSILEDS